MQQYLSRSRPAERSCRRTVDRPNRVSALLAGVAAPVLGLVASTVNAAGVVTEFTLEEPGNTVQQWSLSADRLGAAQLSNPSSLATGGNTYAYVVEFFTPQTSGSYSFGQTAAPLDTVMILYEGSFDPAAPSTNALVGNDDGVHPNEVTVTACGNSASLCPSLTRTLDAGTDYFVVISHFSPAAIASFALPQSFYVVGEAAVGVGGDPPPAAGVIDDSQPFFDEDSGAATAPTVTFDGGRLTTSAPLDLSRPVVVRITGGTVDTQNGVIRFTGEVTGPGTLIVTGGNGLVITDDASNDGGFEVDDGELRVDGTVTGPVVVRAGGTLGGTGVVGGATTVDGRLAPGSSPGTLTFNAPVVQGAGATFDLEIDGTGTGDGAGNFDRVLVTGPGNTFTADGTLAPITRGLTAPADNTFTPEFGQRFRFVEAEGGVLGAFTSVDQPAAGLPAGTRFDVIYGADSIDAVLTPERYAAIGDAGLRETANRRAVGGALDALRPAAGARTDGVAFLDGLYALDGAGIERALDQLAGIEHAHALTTIRAHQELFLTAVRRGGVDQGRGGVSVALSVTEDGAAATPGSAVPEAGGESIGQDLWIRAVGAYGMQDGDTEAPGFDRTGGAVVIGAERAVRDDLSLGVAAGLAASSLDSDGALGNGDIISYEAGLYARFTHGHLVLNGAVAYGFHDVSLERPLDVAGVTATSDYDAHAVSGALEAAYRLPVIASLRAGPFARLRHDWVTRPAFSEDDAGAAGLAVDDETENRFATVVGVSLAYAIDDEAGRTFQAQLDLGWQHRFGPRTSTTDASLAGADITTRGPESSRDAGIVGLGLTGRLDDRWSVDVGWDGSFADGENAHAVTAGLSYRW